MNICRRCGTIYGGNNNPDVPGKCLTRNEDGKECGGRLKEVSCLLCMDTGRVQTKDLETHCPHGCKEAK